jgi:hypothetical protein
MDPDRLAGLAHDRVQGRGLVGFVGPGDLIETGSRSYRLHATSQARKGGATRS